MTEASENTANVNGLMRGKRGLIVGLANNKSIAYGIAQSLSAAGAELAFTYQGDALKKRVEPIVESMNGLLVGHLDVTDFASIDSCFQTIKETWGRIDFLVHAVAFSDKNELTGRYLDTTVENFNQTMMISVHSLTELLKRAEPLLNDQSSVMTLTYYGAEKVIPHYNVMGVAKAALEASVRYLATDLGGRGIRVNAISAGPIKTLAASGIGEIRTMLNWAESNAPLKRLVSISDVGDSALFLLSNLSRGVTGEVMYVDAGYNTIGMKNIRDEA